MINTSNWKEFRVGDLFKIESCKGKNQQLLNEGNDVPYIAASKENNGFNRMVSIEGHEDWVSKGNCLQFIHIGDAAAGYVNYIHTDFIGMSGKSSCAYNDNLNEYNGLFIASIIVHTNAGKYSFKDSWTGTKVPDTVIKLPATPDRQPDWNYMESYMKAVMEESEKSLENLKRADSAKHLVDVSEWGEFDVSDFFTVLSGRNKLSNVDIDDGDTPVYSSNSFNGGIFGYTTKEPDYIVDGTNPFYVTFGDHTKAVNIADKSFCVMDNVKVLATEIHNYNILHFIITSWLRNIPDLGYARHWSIAETSKIHLPITIDGEPDWQYMEDYMQKQFKEAESAISKLQLVV